MPDWFYVERPCSLARPKFVRVPIRDGYGNPIPGEFRHKKIEDAACDSGQLAQTSYTVDGKIVYLCDECSPAKAREFFGAATVTVTDGPALEPAAPAVEKVGDKVLVRLTKDTCNLRDRLVAAGYVARERTRLVTRRGFAACRVATFVRPA